jgi:N utilization substance protein A
MANESPVALFRRTLEMSEVLANAFVAGGIATLEELGYVPISELLNIDGVSEVDAQRFRKAARDYLLRDAMPGNDGDAVDV